MSSSEKSVFSDVSNAVPARRVARRGFERTTVRVMPVADRPPAIDGEPERWTTERICSKLTSKPTNSIQNELTPNAKYAQPPGEISPVPRTREGVVTNRRNEELRAVDTAGPLHCTPVAAGPVSDIAAMDMAFRLRVLSHPVRIKLLSMLFAASRGEECGRVLASTIGLPETTISHHLRQLRLAGFIESRRRGMHIYHRPHPRALNALSATLDPDAERVSGVPESRIDEQPGDRPIQG